MGVMPLRRVPRLAIALSFLTAFAAAAAGCGAADEQPARDPVTPAPVHSPSSAGPDGSPPATDPPAVTDAGPKAAPDASPDAATCSFALTIDPSITPNPSTLPGPNGTSHPIAATRDGAGVTSNVLADVVIFRPANQAELTTFLAKYAGVVIGDDSVPPMAGGGGGLPATSYLIRLDPTTFPLTDIAADAVAIGFCGVLIVSSDAAAHLFALSFHEQRAGRKVGLDFLAESAGH